jgi:flavin reductase (DIM6/NTAB) family NADH-FMN oxidoreductase RutF
VSAHQLDELPEWEDGTVAVLSTGGGRPHAIPVSTGVRAGPDRVLIALALRRESLARLREEPRCALTIMAAGNVALTAHATATIVEEPMAVSDKVAAVRLDVEEIQDHSQPRFEIQAPVQWRWCELEARERDGQIRAALAELAEAQA